MTDYLEGDWVWIMCVGNDHGWHRVASEDTSSAAIPRVTIDNGNSYHTDWVVDHRSKNGPLKVGGRVSSVVGTVLTIETVYGDGTIRLFMQHGRFSESDYTLIKPVEAIEAENEYANEIDLTNEPDLNDVDPARMAACLEKLGWVVMPRDDEVVDCNVVEAVEAESVNEKAVSRIQQFTEFLEQLRCWVADEDFISAAEREGLLIERIEREDLLEDLPNTEDYIWFQEEEYSGVADPTTGAAVIESRGVTARGWRDFLISMGRSYIASGALDAEVKQRMEVIDD